MSLARIHTRALRGIQAPRVEVEVYLSAGLPAFHLVGLPETVVKESRDRVRAAIINSQFEFPTRRITVNLAPADLPKEGGRFDLPIALGILAASGQIPTDAFTQYEFVGELALNGELRPVRGALPTAMAAKAAERRLILPSDNAKEASFASAGEQLLSAESLLSVCQHLHEKVRLPPTAAPSNANKQTTSAQLDLADVKGQFHARRALEVAAAGQHHLILMGPPGTGKSMLAARLPSIMPLMSDAEALQAATVASVSARGFAPENYRQRPFRSPHHTASSVALVGGGSQPRPGEASLAHTGVLFLDELPEFNRQVLEALREPLETGKIHIARALEQAEFPCRFLLVAAANPCPCGYFGDPHTPCRCNPSAVARYQARLSGPFLDRIDLQVDVPRLDKATLRSTEAGESSAAVKARVDAARAYQQQRQGMPNAALQGQALSAQAKLDAGCGQLLDQAINRLNLSARAYDRILKISRTLADLEQQPMIQAAHIAEAIGYRSLDRLKR